MTTIKERKIRFLIYIIIILLGCILMVFSFDNKGIDANVNNLAVSFITSGFVAIIFEIVLKSSTKESVPDVKLLGLGHELKDYFKNKFLKTNESIDIIAISYTVGLKNYGNALIPKILNTNCRIWILILDPGSEFIKLRADDEPDKNPVRIKKNIEESIAEFKSFETVISTMGVKEIKGSLHVKTYNSIPYFGYTRFDNQCVYTPFLIDRYGNYTSALELRDRNAKLSRDLDAHFRNLWAKADNKDIVNIDQGYKV